MTVHIGLSIILEPIEEFRIGRFREDYPAGHRYGTLAYVILRSAEPTAIAIFTDLLEMTGLGASLRAFVGAAQSIAVAAGVLAAPFSEHMHRFRSTSGSPYGLSPAPG